MIRDLPLWAKLLLLVGGFLAVFGTYSYFATAVRERVEVGGPIYTEIIRGKDLIADILPPPGYIIESYLVALELVDERDPAVIEAQVRRGERLREEFDASHERWRRELSGEQLQLMTVSAHRAAVEFFTLRDQRYLPAIRAGEAGAAATALADMKRAYENHRRVVDQIVTNAKRDNADYERKAAAEIGNSAHWLRMLALAVIAIVVGMALYAWRGARQMGSRLKVAAQVATRVAGGDLTARVPHTEDTDETGQLLTAIATMTDNLRDLVSKAKQTSIEMLSSATEFAAASRQQESVAEGFGNSTQQIAINARQISTTANELTMTAESVNLVATQTAELAEEGRTGLKTLDETMDRLAKAAGAMATRLATIREEAAEITSVVTTISKVADQTNLLSINAAIEAEKAGEQGLGFLVLAREIRRLADQTAVATLDIEEMVKSMQAAVSAGVMEIDRFSDEVRGGIAGVERVGGRFGQIISQVRVLSDRFDQVHQGMRSQSQGARQISDALSGLQDGARQTNAALREFNAATENLRDAIGSLKQQIAQFNVG